jgi:acetylornithine deacetylase/succinyl-diaminopimelate desuccinylase-like protein
VASAAAVRTAAEPAFAARDCELLLELLRIRTVTPMETGRPSEVRRAQELIASHAAELGFEVDLHEAPPASSLEAPGTPVAVLETAERMGREEFLACQPSMVLRLGPPRELDRTLMFNAHLDTVGGEAPVAARGDVIRGRGAVDMKGPAVAVLAAIRLALARRPDIADRTTVLLQLVAGEEGGAIGCYGTRALIERGISGRLNVFAEPSGGEYFDACTATMTARLSVAGAGSTDDEPESGENATLLLGHVAAELAARLDEPVCRLGGRLCVGGLHTGTMHDRVYGSGALMVNVAYPSVSTGRTLEREVEASVRAACASFERRFASVAVARRTAASASRLCQLTWLKRGLPTLSGRDPEIEALLSRAGIGRLPDSRARERFTCDAIWGSLAPGHTIVFGPGRLGPNGAHADSEHVHRRDLERYARAAAELVLRFDDRAGGGRV